MQATRSSSTASESMSAAWSYSKRQRNQQHIHPRNPVWQILLRVDSGVQGCAKLDFPIRRRVSTTPSQLPLHGPLDCSSHTQPAVVIPCLSTSTLVTVPSLLPPTAPYLRPLRTLPHSLPHLSLPSRGETRNAFRGSHTTVQHPTYRVSHPAEGHRCASPLLSYPAVTVHLVDTAAPSHPHTRRPPRTHHVPLALHAPDRFDTTE
jgi:hypothetical protein